MLTRVARGADHRPDTFNMTQRLFHPTRINHRHRRGLALFWLIVFFLLLLIFAAFGIEMAWLRVQHTRAHVAAEASALAAANTLAIGRPGAAESAIDIAAANVGVNDSVILLADPHNDGGDLRFGRWNIETGSFKSALLAPDAVEVTVRFRKDHPNGPVPLMFGSFIGADATNVSARAVAQARPRDPVPAALIVLGALAPRTLSLNGAVSLDANGRVGVQSDSNEAIDLRNQSTMTAALVTVEGGVSTDSDDSIMGMLRTNTPIGAIPTYLPLPLDGLSTRPDIQVFSGEVLLEPGHYPNGLVASEGAYRLRGGIYLFGGAGIVLNRNAGLMSENAIIVLDDGANISLDGSHIQLAAPDFSEDGNPLSAWAGLALSSAPDAEPLIFLEGDAHLEISGGIHAPNGRIELNNAHLTATHVVIDSIEATNHAHIELGEAQRHPIDVFIVH